MQHGPVDFPYSQGLFTPVRKNRRFFAASCAKDYYSTSAHRNLLVFNPVNNAFSSLTSSAKRRPPTGRHSTMRNAVWARFEYEGPPVAYRDLYPLTAAIVFRHICWRRSCSGSSTVPSSKKERSTRQQDSTRRNHRRLPSDQGPKLSPPPGYQRKAGSQNCASSIREGWANQKGEPWTLRSQRAFFTKILQDPNDCLRRSIRLR